MSVRNQSKRLLGRVLGIASFAGAICMMFSGSAAAQSYNKKTTVTFNVPVEIPGVDAQVLPAGTYVFKLLDSPSDRHIVQIFNKDETHIYSTILAIPNYRLKATDKTVMTFAERATGEPQAIRAWFYPGDNSGQEFVYPKKRAVVLAKAANVPVLYIPDEIAPNYTAPIAAPTDPPAVALREAPIKAVRPTGETIEIAEVVVPPPVQTAHLPKTASELPLLAMMGFLMAGLAVSMRALCNH
jgi:hypothetical protein